MTDDETPPLDPTTYRVGLLAVAVLGAAGSKAADHFRTEDND